MKSGGTIAGAIAGLVAREIRGIVRSYMFGDLARVRLGLGSKFDFEPKALEFVVSFSLPWFERAMPPVGRGWPKAFAERGVWVAMTPVVMMSFLHLLYYIMMRVVFKNWPSRQSWDFKIYAYSSR